MSKISKYVPARLDTRIPFLVIILLMVAILIFWAHPRKATGTIESKPTDSYRIIEVAGQPMMTMKVGDEWQFSRDIMWLTRDRCYLDAHAKPVSETDKSMTTEIERIWVRHDKDGFVLSRYHGSYFIHSQPAPPGYVRARIQNYKTWDW